MMGLAGVAFRCLMMAMAVVGGAPKGKKRRQGRGSGGGTEPVPADAVANTVVSVAGVGTGVGAAAAAWGTEPAPVTNVTGTGGGVVAIPTGTGPAMVGKAKPSVVAGGGGVKTYDLGVPSRWQYDGQGGYCGEVSLQMLMMKHGAWISQEEARRAGGGELLPGVNYEQAMKKLHIKYEKFKGKGFQPFMEWAKRWVMRGVGVVLVAFYKGGRFQGYDHVMPAVGFRTSSAAYSPDDVVFVNSGYSSSTTQRRLGDYSCTYSTKKGSLAQAGCVPTDTKWGYAILGPTYADPAAPKLELKVRTNKEPGIGKSEPFKGELVVSGLTPGRRYAVVRVTDLGAVPQAPGQRATGTKVSEFQATTQGASVEVTFESRRVAYFFVQAM